MNLGVLLVYIVALALPCAILWYLLWSLRQPESNMPSVHDEPLLNRTFKPSTKNPNKRH